MLLYSWLGHPRNEFFACCLRCLNNLGVLTYHLLSNYSCPISSLLCRCEVSFPFFDRVSSQLFFQHGRSPKRPVFSTFQVWSCHLSLFYLSKLSSQTCLFLSDRFIFFELPFVLKCIKYSCLHVEINSKLLDLISPPSLDQLLLAPKAFHRLFSGSLFLDKVLAIVSSWLLLLMLKRLNHEGLNLLGF